MKKLFLILASIAFAGSVFAGSPYKKSLLNDCRNKQHSSNGCPSKTIYGKVLGYDEESQTLTVSHGWRPEKAGGLDRAPRNQITAKEEEGIVVKVQVGYKTQLAGFDCPTKLKKGARVTIDGCVGQSIKNKTAYKIALRKG